MITLRDYQNDANGALWRYFSEHSGNPLVLMPTGTGKAVLQAAFIRDACLAYPGTRVIAVTHVETLISQNFATLLRHWPSAPAGIYSAALNRKDLRCAITFASIQSIYTVAAAFGHVDLVLVDEAHLVSPKDATMYAKFCGALLKKNPKCKFVGLTATGWRMDNGPLVGDGIFTDVAIDMTTTAAWNWFVDCGYLAPLYSKPTNFVMDADGVGMVGNDYNLGQLQEHVDRDTVTRAAVEESLVLGAQREAWMVFGAGIRHCDHIADMLSDYGVPAVSIHNKSKHPEKLLEAFKRGDYRAAVSMNKLTTGVDIPHLDFIVVMRNTWSSSMHVQMLGRGARPVYAEGFDLRYIEQRLAAMAASRKPNGCLVADFARNIEHLGPVNAPVIPERKNKKAGGGSAPVRVCPVCMEYCPAAARFCRACGHEFAITVHIERTASTHEVMVREAPPPPPPPPPPVVEELTVERVTYAVHKKKNRPNSLRVSYFCDTMRMFQEYICFEHDKGAAHRARNWWRARAIVEHEEPETTAQAYALALHVLKAPAKLRVWTNKPQPEIVSHVFAD
jgi:DNA repair protein RadD